MTILRPSNFSDVLTSAPQSATSAGMLSSASEVRDFSLLVARINLIGRSWNTFQNADLLFLVNKCGIYLSLPCFSPCTLPIWN